VAVVPVLRYPHPALKERCRPLDLPAESALAERVARDLVETMRAQAACVGLAAPQLGDLVRLVAIDVTGHRKAMSCHGLAVLANPAIAEADGDELGREGCLSIPDLTANVRRATRVVVEALTPTGDRVRLEADAFEARVLQHELDHLDGILFLDRVASRQDLFRRKSYR
jgi:peptide deformylase